MGVQLERVHAAWRVVWTPTPRCLAGAHQLSRPAAADEALLSAGGGGALAALPAAESLSLAGIDPLAAQGACARRGARGARGAGAARAAARLQVRSLGVRRRETAALGQRDGAQPRLSRLEPVAAVLRVLAGPAEAAAAASAAQPGRLPAAEEAGASMDTD